MLGTDFKAQNYEKLEKCGENGKQFESLCPSVDEFIDLPCIGISPIHFAPSSTNVTTKCTDQRRGPNSKTVLYQRLRTVKV